MFQNLKTEWKLFGVVALVAIIVVVGILLLISFGNPITPSEPDFLRTQEAGELKKTESTVEIDISAIETTNCRSFVPYAKITIKTPRDWYPKTYPEEPNSVTYGSGIVSFLTIRYFDDLSIEDQRINRFIEEGRSVTKEVVRIGTREFTRHTIGSKCVSDVCDFGFRDWYVVFDEDVFIFSENTFYDQEKAIVAAVLASVKKFSSGVAENTIDTSDWQIYRNDDYGFEFQYPSGWGSQENFGWPIGIALDDEHPALSITLGEEDLYGTIHTPRYIRFYCEDNNLDRHSEDWIVETKLESFERQISIGNNTKTLIGVPPNECQSVDAGNCEQPFYYGYLCNSSNVVCFNFSSYAHFSEIDLAILESFHFIKDFENWSVEQCQLRG